jgi:hypothetical protein
VFDHDSSQHDSEVEGISGDESNQESDAMADDVSDLDEGYDGYNEDEHADGDDSAGDVAPPEIVLPPPFARCFQHWLVSMRGILRALSTSAAASPSACTPKCVSLLQMGEHVVWFALEASQTQPKLEGRIVGLDNSAKVKYKDPGPKRIHVLDVAPGLAAGVNKFLLHTRTEHVKSADMRMAISDDNLMVARLWHNILCQDVNEDVRCRGCGTSRQQCTLCMSLYPRLAV